MNHLFDKRMDFKKPRRLAVTRQMRDLGQLAASKFRKSAATRET